MSAFAQNPPVAIPDTAQVMNQKIASIYPLLNDYDPDGDTVEIVYLQNPNHGESWYEDSIVYYQSEWFEGWDRMRYKIAKTAQPAYESEYEYIRVEVLHNPDIPIAVADSFQAVFLESTELQILDNDYDPNGNDFMIKKVFPSQYTEVEVSSDSTYVIFTAKHSPYPYHHFDYEIIERNTTESYYSYRVSCIVYPIENPDAPIAVADTFEATGGITAVFDVLANDHDPLGDSIEFIWISDPQHGIISEENNQIYYTANTSYAGSDGFRYAFRYKNKPWLYTDVTEVNIYINKNPDCPVGVSDYGSGLAYDPITIDVLANDYDPNGKAVEIMDVKTFSLISQATFEGSHISYTSNAYYIGPDSIQYRIRQTDDHDYFSEWTTVYFDISQNPALPVANDDYAYTKGGISVSIDIMENDIFPDSLELVAGHMSPWPIKGKVQTTDSTIQYTPFMNSYGKDSLQYLLKNMSIFPFFFASGKVYIDIEKTYSNDSLTINNINAGIHSSGLLFSRGNEILGQGIHNYAPHFEVPKGSGKHTFFTNNIWLGGLDNNDSLHLAGERYKQMGTDFQPGPVSNLYDSAYFYDWSGTWMLYQEEVEYHINNWWQEGYSPIRSIAEWPGNGDLTMGQAEQLAPYYDHDNNGIYDPMQGDYPLIRGDQCILFIYNDDRIHTETDGERLIVEIHGMAYAFDAPEDSILNNTVFIHYDLINRSDNVYYNFFFGLFADLEIGYAWDDYIGSYVKGSSFYGYNGLEIDGNGEPEAYGENPPSQSVTVLAGPFMDPDSEDNPDGGCDYSVTGVNFGNGIVDDERYGLTRFTYYNNAGGPQGDPSIAEEYYGYLHGYWKDNTPVIFGGSGHSISYEDWSACRFMFPGESDPLNWGTDCELPIGGYNQNDIWWTMENEQYNPSDRRGMGSCGPITFHPGEVQEVEMAYICANSYQGADSSRKLLFQYIDDLRQSVQDGEIIVPNSELDINDVMLDHQSFEIYPNPAREVIYLSSDNIKNANYNIINILGTTVQSGSLFPDTRNEINIAGLKPGLYIIAIITEDGGSTNKLIKH